MIRGTRLAPEKIVELLDPYISEERASRLSEVVASRTRSVVTVVEGAANYGNVSAVMRTAEALGFFEVHVVTGNQPYKQSRRTSQGAEKWLDLRTWERSTTCITSLRQRGYRIAVTDSGPDAVPVSEVDFIQPTAVVLGNEVDGVSPETRASADLVCRIDMNGFVESYNISVAAALVLYQAYRDRISRADRNGDLSDAEQLILKAHYYVRAVQHAEHILAESVRRSGNPD